MTDHEDPDELDDHEFGPCKQGIDWELEEAADTFLAHSRKGILRSQDKDPYQVLTPGQMERRRGREVYNRNGSPNPHLFSGIFNRAHNPNMANRRRKVANVEDLDASEFGTHSYWGGE